MDITATIRRGWEVTWNNKFMWVLGFLAALAGGNSVFQYTYDSGDFEGISPEAMTAVSAGIIALICVGIILGIVLALVSLAARGGLVAAAAGIDQGETYSFKQAFRAGWSKIWRLIGMSLLLYGIIIVGGLVVLVLLLASGGGAAALLSAFESGDGGGAALAGVSLLVLCAVSLCCLLIPVGLALQFIHAFAFRGIILRDLGAAASIRHGWQVVRSNLANIIMLALAFLILNALVSLVAVALLVPFGLLVAAPIALLQNADASALQGIIAVAGILVALVVFALVSAVVTAWQSATFTLAYQQMTDKGGKLSGELPAEPLIE